MKSPVKQPAKIKFNGTTYVRVAKYKQVSPAISEGPFYRDQSHALDHPYVYLPDARFLLGLVAAPFYMHRIGPLPAGDPLLAQ